MTKDHAARATGSRSFDGRSREGDRRPFWEKSLAVAMALMLAVGLLPAAAYAEAGERSGLQAATAEGLEVLQATVDDVLAAQSGEAIQYTGTISGDTVSGNKVYVRDGDSVEFKLGLKNATSSKVSLVNMAVSPTYKQADEDVEPFSFPAKSYISSQKFNDAVTGTGVSWNSSFDMRDDDKAWYFAGYDFTASAEASITMSFDAGSLSPGEYNYTVKLGKAYDEYELRWWGPYSNWYSTDNSGFTETFSADIPITVVVYAQEDAAIQVGKYATSGTIEPNFSQSAPYSLGTFDLNSNPNANGHVDIAVRNVGNADTPKDAHQMTTDMSAGFGFEPISYDFGPLQLSQTGWNYSRGTSLEHPTTSSGSTAYGTMTEGIYYDVKDVIAGTYTANLIVRTMPKTLKVNGEAGVDSAAARGTSTPGSEAYGVYKFPVSITLTGTNSNLLARPTDLAAKAGNGMVELTWTPPADAQNYTTYTVYRRTGTETQTDPDKLDWNGYEEVGTVTKGTNSTLTFVDGTASNGARYTYTVIAGKPYHGYAAKTATATPSASAAVTLLAPQGGANQKYVSTKSAEGGVQVSWYMNDAYGFNASNGEGIVDHFNVYRNGELVKKVYRNAVTDFYNSSDQTHSYSWSCFVETPQLYVDYAFSVAAVSKTGVEGYRSEVTGHLEGYNYGYTEAAPTILGHRAVAVQYNEYIGPDTADDNVYWRASNWLPALQVHIETRSGDSTASKLEFWRADGTASPNVNQAPYATADISGGYYSYSVEYTDTNVALNKTYTYTVRAIDSNDKVSDYYTFTAVIAPEDANYDKATFERADVDWKVANNTTPTLSFTVPERATAYVYRNNTRVATYAYTPNSYSNYKTYAETPTANGTYTFRVDTVTSGITTRGRDYVFTKGGSGSSSVVDRPDTPDLVSARVSDGAVVLRWDPSTAGGAAEGYHIYRKDAGSFVEGTYYNGYSNVKWGSNRYLTIQDDSTVSLVDPQYSKNYQDKAELGQLSGLSWAADKCPHEYYITAYNEAGESEPSRVASFTYEGTSGTAPGNHDTAVPGKPSINDVWVEWSDDSTFSVWDDVIGGNIRVSWDDYLPSTDVDSWKVHFDNSYYEWGDETISYATALSKNMSTQGGMDLASGTILTSKQKDLSDYKRTVTVTVTASNSAGTSAPASQSVVVTDLPRLALRADNGSVAIRWTKLVNDTTTQVRNWEIWRKDAYSVWQRVTSISADGLQRAGQGQLGSNASNKVDYYAYTDEDVRNGYEYEYKVIAKCADGIDRPSAVRTVTPTWTAVSEVPGKVSDLKAEVVNGEVLLSWSKPSTGAEPQYYSVYRKDPGSSNWTHQGGDLLSNSTSMSNEVRAAGTYEYFVYTSSYLDGQSVPRMNFSASSVDDIYPNHSNIVSIAVSQNQVNSRASTAPDAPVLTATPGDSQITISWPGAARATSYELQRYEGANRTNRSTGVNVVLTTADGVGGSYSYTDLSAEPGVKFYYEVRASNSAGSRYSMVEARATGKTRDQVAAESVSELIQALPAPDAVVLDDVSQIEDVQAVWEALTDAQRALVSSALQQKLADDVAKAKELKILIQYSDVANEVQAKIDALPAANLVKESDRSAIEEARTAYGSLNAQAKKLVNATKLVAAENALAAQGVVAKINALPAESSVQLSNESAITEARSAYDALSSSQQPYVSNYDKLVAVEARILDLKAVSRVTELIDRIPDSISTANLDAVTTATRAAREAYGQLTSAQIALLDDSKKTKLANSETKIDDLQEVVKVEAMLDALPEASDITADTWKSHRDQVKRAHDAYDGLSTSQKGLVASEKTAKLTAAESAIQSCAQAIIDEANRINVSIPAASDVTLESENAITQARNGYANANEDVRYYVDLDKLKAAESALVAKQQEKLEQECASATLTGGAAFVKVGDTTTFTAPDIANATRTWSATDVTAVTLEPGGTDNATCAVKGVKGVEGTVGIIVTYERTGYAGAKLEAGVSSSLAVVDASLSNAGDVELNDTRQFMARCTHATAFTWSSSDASIATVDNTGLVTGVAIGEVTITATESTYGFTLTKKIKVTAIALTSLDLTPVYYRYDGLDHTPSAEVHAKSQLVNEADYDIAWPTDMRNAGTKTVTATGKGNYTGTVKATFTISPASLTSMSLTATRYTYNGKSQRPGVNVYAGATRLSAASYAVAYPSNTTSPGTKTVTVTGRGNYTGTLRANYTIVDPGQTMYRLYNPNSGEHLYTYSVSEYNYLGSIGWKKENVAWIAPQVSSSAVYRLYNPNNGDHHYTTSASERSFLIRIGWRDEKIGWYSDTARNKPVYRLFNPNLQAGSHHYTTSASERRFLISIGWKDEGIGWYGLR